ncbi:MAG: inorganic diphosphatase, partial [Acidobacteriota bacterium]|nr:inorganic diphosphatase [Acidobacteriota bacterium]
GCTAAGREMVHEVRDGARRVIRHIGYPGNYGAIPRTRAGDGDPLDVIAIGPAAQRGTVIPVRIVGVIRCMDGDDQDDKLVAITRDSPLHGVSSAAELEAKAPQAADIIFRWFMSYKGADAMACSPMADQTVAAALIAEGRSAFTAP